MYAMYVFRRYILQVEVENVIKIIDKVLALKAKATTTSSDNNYMCPLRSLIILTSVCTKKAATFAVQVIL